MVNGTDTADFTFLDEDRNRIITVTMEIQQGIKLKLLERIAKELRRRK